MSTSAGPRQADQRLPLKPRAPALAGVLANQVVVELYRLPGPVTAQLKLHVAAAVANRGGWKGYRGGRQRLAGWVGVYTEWMAPKEGWTFEPLVALDQTWPSWGDGQSRFADIVAPGTPGDLDLGNLASIATGLLETGEVDAVRVLTVSAPLASRVFTAAGPRRGVPLVETELSFTEQVA
jgi:hypothetical protein